MKKYTFLFLLLTFAKIADAQYTYITDRRFFDPTDLIGYDFRPDRMEIPDEMEDEISAGDYSFGISFNNLFVEGENIKGVYNINNISPTDYGYKLLLMNARDARLQGHLKVILNKYAMVELLIFKRSPDEKEIIFYLPPIPKKLQQQERGYFTDRGEMLVEDPDSLWGQKIIPFHRIYTDQNIQQPLSMRDSTNISFVKEVTVEEKIKKTKPVKKKKKEKNKEEEVSMEEVMNAEVDTVVVEKKVKIITKYYVILRSILTYDDGTQEDKTWKFETKKVNTRQDDNAKLDEEKYEWEFVTEKGEEIKLYLNGDNTISTMNIGNQRYLMRGF